MTTKLKPKPGNMSDFMYMMTNAPENWAGYIMEKYGMTLEEHDRSIYMHIFDYDLENVDGEAEI